jgi:hypothetical protein
MAELKADICYIKRSLDTNETQHREILDKIDAITKHAAERFADKNDQEKIMKRFDQLSGIYVSREEFKPVKAIIYGMVGFVLLAFLSAVVGFVITAKF